MPAYPDTARALIAACDRYLEGRLDLAAIKAAIWASAEQVIAADERDMRDFLQTAEGRLDMIEHTTDSSSLSEATTPLISEVRDRAVSYLSG